MRRRGPEPRAAGQAGRASFGLLVAFVAAGAAGAGYWTHAHLLGAGAPGGPEVVSLARATTQETSPDLPRPRPAFTLPDTDGRARDVAEWDGKVLVVNFWATWCPPCLHEIPMFVELQREYRDRGVQFLGIALDQVENVRDFAAETGLNYPSLHGQQDAIEVGRAYGNRTGALPYTAIVSPDGRIVQTRAGVYTEEEIRAALEAVLES